MVSSSVVEKVPQIVYFALAEGTDRVKIGRTNNIKRRLKDLQTGCPVPLKVIYELPGDNSLEKELHKRFSHLWIDYEWFQFAEEMKVFLGLV